MKKSMFVASLSILVLAFVLLRAQETETLAESEISFDRESYAVGDTMELTFVYRNLTEENIQVTELDLDRQSVNLSIKFEKGKMQTWTRIHDGVTSLKKYAVKTIEPGQSIEMKLRIPALKTGGWTFQAKFYKNEDESVDTKPVSVKVQSKGKAKEALVKLETAHGDMLIRLFPERVMGTVINFAVNVNDSFYDGLVFHRIIKDFMIQGGDPDGNGSGGPGYSIPFDPDPVSHVRGVISMARTPDIDSAGSQFFICHGNATFLDAPGYCGFGELVQGLDTLDKIANVAVKASASGGKPSSPEEEVKIQKASIVVVQPSE